MMLGILEKVSAPKAEAVVRWFDPAILWIQRWLGAFYVPSLAVLPLTINGIAGMLHVPTQLHEGSHADSPCVSACPLPIPFAVAASRETFLRKGLNVANSSPCCMGDPIIRHVYC